MSARSVTAALVLVLTACSKPPLGSAEPPEGGAPPLHTTAPANAPPAVASSGSPGETGGRPGNPAPEEPGLAPPLGVVGSTSGPASEGAPPAAEARRTSLRRLEEERALVPHRALLEGHFDGALPSPLELQAAALPGDRRAYLVYGEARRRNPLLLVVAPPGPPRLDGGSAGDLLWTKERPLAGTRQIVTEMVIAPGPEGEVALLWCDIPTQIVALRKWSAAGVVLADFQVIEVDVCEALSGLYWPGRGWVAVASQHGAARAQLLDELGKRAWGPRGNELPWTARPSAPASIGVDSEASVILFQVGDLRRGEGTSPDRVLAMRYDTLGTALWERPLDLGPAPPGASAPRISAAVVAPGQVRVTLGPRIAATVTSAGAILGAR
jgi:hypothetical protein